MQADRPPTERGAGGLNQSPDHPADHPADHQLAEAVDVAGEPIAVIDIGSNSGRMVVFRFREGGHLDILEDARWPLRLGRSLRKAGGLGEEAIDRTIEALQDFRAVALGAGATRTLAVATSAVRDAIDGEVLLRRAQNETGIDLHIIDGDREAVLGFLGAIHDLPVVGGIAMDVGGGSMELTRFRDRRAEGSWTLPLGSLRLSDAYLASDPPSEKEIRRLQEGATSAIRAARVPPLRDGETLVGIGGTVRNLAKIDRRRVDYPLPLLHGYVLARDRLVEVVRSLAAKKMSRRVSTPGLNPDRADSIVGGGLAVLAAMEVLGADQLVVSSRGLREGAALHEVSNELPPPLRVRAGSIANLAARFATWEPQAATRRAAIAGRLLDALEPEAPAHVQEMLEHAARIVDVGRAIDYYDRFEHAAMLVTAADLGGFTHAHVSLLTGILRQADDGGGSGAHRGLLSKEELAAVRRAATILALADELNRRIPPNRPAQIECGWAKKRFRVVAPVPAGWRPRGVADRFHQVFGGQLIVEARDA